jgi:uncharacterized membrane protein YbaN (DUF454 family)
MKHLVKSTLGCFFLVLGVIGLFLPVLQGVLFIMVGLMILSSVSPTVQRIFGKVAQKYPGQYQKLKSIEQKVIRIFRRDE